jgi:hypothetical protein
MNVDELNALMLTIRAIAADEANEEPRNRCKVDPEDAADQLRFLLTGQPRRPKRESVGYIVAWIMSSNDLAEIQTVAIAINEKVQAISKELAPALDEPHGSA